MFFKKVLNLILKTSFSDWSVIYVGIFFSIVVAAIICTAAFVICKKKKKSIRPRKRYTRLEQNEQNIEMRRESEINIEIETKQLQRVITY